VPLWELRALLDSGGRPKKKDIKTGLL